MNMYGEEVETLVVDEDEQSFEMPIIKPVRDIKFEVGVKDSSQFLLALMLNQTLVRNVTLVGAFAAWEDGFYGYVG
ncbi:110 kDa U5 small nuclear ribonucleoprotein component CLO [Tanacetum coccineum]